MSATARRRRPTKQQRAVAEALAQAGDFVSAQQLHARMLTDGTAIGLATVYRTLSALAATDEVDQLRTTDGEAVYRACGAGHHHHHLVCRDCGRTVEVAGRLIEEWAQEMADQHGFRDVTHTLELVGTCTSC